MMFLWYTKKIFIVNSKELEFFYLFYNTVSGHLENEAWKVLLRYTTKFKVASGQQPRGRRPIEP